MHETNETASPVRHRIPPWLQSPERRQHLAEFCKELMRAAKEEEAWRRAAEEVETNV